MACIPSNPLIVQSDRTILLDVHADRASAARDALIPFAELEKSPEHLHTYRLTPLSLWNAAAAGWHAGDVVHKLSEYARFPVPPGIDAWITGTMERFGKLRLVARDPAAFSPPAAVTPDPDSAAAEPRDADSRTAATGNAVAAGHHGDPDSVAAPVPDSADVTGQKADADDMLLLVTEDRGVYRQLASSKQLEKYLVPVPEEPSCTEYRFFVELYNRGTVKQQLLKAGWPVLDEVPLRPGAPLDVTFRTECRSGKPFVLRDYQQEAAAALVGDLRPGTGFGTIVLPCGSGKTIVGMSIMEMLKTSTLILTTNVAAVHQWINELLDKTELNPDDIGEYTGSQKEIKPVTVATYQVLTWRPAKDGPYPHMRLFRDHAWGLIIYDEVHMLPAPVFRVTAEIQAVRRAGLTATLVREDGCEGDVFSLVGPKRFDVPWKNMEAQGWIADATCEEIRIDLDPSVELAYAVANQREKHKLAADNPAKLPVVAYLCDGHRDDRILVIGQYVSQLEKIAAMIHAPLITGKTPNQRREALYDDFRSGKERILVVSKVANFAIDLPDASVAVQVSGTFGSRQEEAQRLGRILRPKDRPSVFYSLVTRSTVEEEFASNRQKFLAEQGYSYTISRWNGTAAEIYTW